MSDASKKGGKASKDETGNLWFVALAGSFLVLLGGAGMAVLSAKDKIASAKYMEFVDGYDEGEFLVIIGVLGLVSAFVGIYGVTVAYLSSTPEKFKRIRYLVLAFAGWGMGLVVLLLISFWMTYTAAGSLELVFMPGFTASLVKYVKEQKIKTSIDALQRDLECCGNYNHSEWFTVSWSNTSSKSETAIPESCCDVAKAAAQRTKCVSSTPFGEAIKLTVNKKGCVSELVKYYGGILKLRCAIIIGIAIVELGVVAIVMLQIRSSDAAVEEMKAKNETKQLLVKKAVSKKDSSAEASEKASAYSLPKVSTEQPPVHVDPYAAGYVADPFAAGYGAVPGYGGPAYNMYYGAPQ